MPSPLVNRYSLFVSLPERGKVRGAISTHPSLLLAVESCFAAYESTGHFGYVIEDRRPARAFTLERKILLAIRYLRAYDLALYYDLLNRLDRSGDQGDLETALARYVEG